MDELWNTLGGTAREAWTWLANWQPPSREEVVRDIRSLSPVQAAVMLAGGLIYLLQGWRVFRFLVVINGAIAGVLIGSVLGGMQSSEWSLYGALIGGVVLAALCWPMMRLAVALTGAMAGGVVGLGLWKYVAHWQPSIEPHAWAGGIIGALLLGVLAFFLFRMIIVVITSVQGSAMTVGAILALTLLIEQLRKPLLNELTRNPHLLPALLAVPALIGILVQLRTAPKKNTVRNDAPT